MLKLALFDVDFTLTKKETMIEYFKFIVGKDPLKLVYLPRAMASGLLFKMGIFKEKASKELFLHFIRGHNTKELEHLSNEYYDTVLKNLLYQDGLDKMHELKMKGYTVVLISASPEFYLNTLYNLKDVDQVIGTRFTMNEDIFISKMHGQNNKGEEKIVRLYEYLKDLKVDYENSYMFSDSMSDAPLLRLVGKPYLINYRKKNPQYPVLYWR